MKFKEWLKDKLGIPTVTAPKRANIKRKPMPRYLVVNPGPNRHERLARYSRCSRSKPYNRSRHPELQRTRRVNGAVKVQKLLESAKL